MSGLDIGELASSMIGAAKGSLADDWPKIRDFAEPEFKKLASSLADIERLHASGKIDEVEAGALLDMHRNTTRTVLLTLKGMGLLAAEAAINAALAVVKDVVNAALKFALI